MKNDRPQIEILPSPAEIKRQPVDRAELDKLVKEQVAEILAARDEFEFEPFFRSRQISYELKRIQTMPERRKWQIFYQRYGCMLCHTQERIHVGNGMCNKCHSRIFQTLKQIIAEQVTGRVAAPSGQPSRALLPSGTDIHLRWNKRLADSEAALYQRVADQLNVSPEAVRRVAIGQKQSKAISAALENEKTKRTRK